MFTNGNYGKEVIIDIHECSIEKFSRPGLKKFFDELCHLIDMEQEDLHFWDYIDTPEEDRPKEAHLLGTSAVQFIKTSNIVIHTLEILKHVYLNVFSCKDFNATAVAGFCAKYFDGEVVNMNVIPRK